LRTVRRGRRAPRRGRETGRAAPGIGAGALDRDDRLFVNINTPHDDARARNAVMLEPLADRITEKQ
jgi:hypothetical protein